MRIEKAWNERLFLKRKGCNSTRTKHGNDCCLGFILSLSDGDVFGEDPSRKIVSLNFESFLDGKILLSSLNVAALIICESVVYLLMHYCMAFKDLCQRGFLFHRGKSTTSLMFSPKTHLPVHSKSGLLAGEVSHTVLLAPGNVPAKKFSSKTAKTITPSYHKE